jgi:hypothetical protein
MDDAESVGFFKNIANLSCDLHGTRRAETTFTLERLRKSFTFDKFHDDEVTTVWQVSGVKNGRRVLMPKFCHRPRFTQETLGHVAVAGKFTFNDFYCDGTLESKVSGKIDRSHTAGSDHTFDPESTGYNLGDIHI